MHNLLKRRGLGRDMSVRALRGQEAIRAAVETLETRVLLSTVTYTVQTNSDTVASIITPSGANAYTANTLRAAVNSANNQSFPVVIQFNTAKFTSAATNTITLTSGLTLGPVSPAGTHSYKFVGPTAKPITVSGAGTYTDFTINTGISAEFDTLTIAHGVATNTGADGDTDGGAIYSAGPLTLSGDSFASNTALNGNGGAVYNDSGLITVTNTTFTANSAELGGGLAVEDVSTGAAPKITGSTFTSNIASEGGGGIANLSYVNSTFTVTNSTFTGNDGEGGGAIGSGSYAGTLTESITGSKFTNNNATIYEGGAIDSAANSLTLSSDTFTGNSATDSEGGAIFSEDGTLTVTSCTFSNDSAAEGGGAIVFGEIFEAVAVADVTPGDVEILPPTPPATPTTLTVTSSTFTNDSTSEGSGGAILDGENDFGSGMENLLSLSTTLTSDTFTGDTADEVGGAVASGEDEEPTLVKPNIIEGSSSLTVTNNTFSQDTAQGPGGGIYSTDTTLAISGTTFAHDKSAEDDGGGVYSEATTLTVNKSSFTNDSALDGGGLAFFDPDGTGTVTNSTFSGDIVTDNDNEDGYGGAIASYSDQLTVSGSTFTNDSAAYAGGAIASEDFTLVVDNSSFSNDTGGSGGGIAFYGDTATVTNSTFTGDTANDGSGGGIYINDEPEAPDVTTSAKPFETDGSGGSVVLNVSNDTFTNDTAVYNGGAISFYFEGEEENDGVAAATKVTPFPDPEDADNGYLNINDSTFTDNSAGEGGGAVYAEALDEGDNLNIFNSTFNGNSTSSGGGGGVYDEFSISQIANDTFYANAAGNDLGGGGLYVSDGDADKFVPNFDPDADINATVTDSTFDNNSAGYGLGGGIAIGNALDADVVLDGNIVAKNYVVGTPSTDNDLEGAFDPASTDNIIGDGSFDQTGFTVGNVGGNFVGTNLKPINPMLGALANNGGPTQTQALLSGSLAIGNNSDFPVFDFNDNDVTLTDQRGVDRPQDQGYDIGAYQSGATVAGVTPTVSISAPATVHVPSSGTTTIQIPVTLSSTAGSAIVLTYSTIGGTATSGNGDYNGVTNATATIPAGSAAGTYFITITGVKHETAHGAYPKTFQVKLTAATNATVVGGTESITVTLAYP